MEAIKAAMKSKTFKKVMIGTGIAAVAVLAGVIVKTKIDVNGVADIAEEVIHVVE